MLCYIIYIRLVYYKIMKSKIIILIILSSAFSNRSRVKYLNYDVYFKYNSTRLFLKDIFYVYIK